MTTRSSRAGNFEVALATGGLLLMLVAAPAAQAEAQRGAVVAASLKNAPIPASCGHPATTLDGYSKDFGPDGFAKLRIKKAVSGTIGNHSGKLTVVPLLCSAGGVSWPELLLVYDRSARLVGKVNLANIPNAQEHETVTGLRLSGRTVRVTFSGEDGCCDAVSTHRGTLGWKHGKLAWHHQGPLTVDFAVGRSGPADIGPGIVNKPADADLWLKPAPSAFRDFIRHRWKKLQTATRPYCSFDAAIAVARFSHKGFASGDETACGGAQYLWTHAGGRWHRLSGSQDYFPCGSAMSLQRRAVTALAITCMNYRTGKKHHYGHWPRSGQ